MKKEDVKMKEEMKLSPEELKTITGGNLREGSLTEGDMLWLDVFIEGKKLTGHTMEDLLAELTRCGCSDQALGYVKAHWDSK